ALSLEKALNRLRVHEESWTTLLGLLGNQDVPALHRIFKQCKRRNWSIEKLVEKIRDALAGKYHPKNYSDVEYDLATTIYELGGGATLFALHKSMFAFPCLSTLDERRQEFKLRISIGSLKMSDLFHNIKIMFEDDTPGLRRVGMSLLMDEISCDERLCYLAGTDDIAGLCEHAAEQFSSMKVGQDLEVVRAIAQAVRSGKVDVGGEVFVMAMARNDEVGYGARPIALVVVCKKKTYRHASLTIEMGRQAWRLSPYGDRLHGPIWSIASDGDPKRRPALYLHCMVRELLPTDPLFSQLVGLVGLNLWVGSGGETQDLDFKHNFKRICKCLCAREGILINNVVITKSVLASWFARLTDTDWSEDTAFSLLNNSSGAAQRINSLLSPKDAQDVPRAIKLLTVTADLRKLDNSNFDPSEQVTFHSLSLLGEMLDALVEPFINPDFSLSEQIISLVKFAFIACALFMKHEGDFMPHHLYSDLQCMVRTAIFRVAHTKNLDPSMKVFLCLL
ncbi:hypothetical protein CPB83DRAFT_733454, partial [Crepidotus variabilis]